MNHFVAPPTGISANTLIGSPVKNLVKDEDIGKVSNLSMDRDGRVLALVIGVGGFLGIGEKEVAVPWGQLKITWSPDDEEYVVQLNTTKEALESAPEFKKPESR